LVFQKDVLYRLPQGPLTLFTSQLLTLREKWRMAGLLAGFQRIKSQRFDRLSAREWVHRTLGTGNLAAFAEALFRLNSYANDPERLSAGAAIRQLQVALAGNVLYLDGGWQTLIDGLRAKVAEHGSEIRTGARVESVRNEAGSVTVRLANGEVLQARCAVLAVPPGVACELLDASAETPLGRQAAGCIPVRAACLDLALGKLPRPSHRFALGLDQPLYYSVHSAVARLAPEGVAVVHLMKYLGDDNSPAEIAEREMEALLERVQPGWRQHVISRRFLPGMTVAHDLPRAAEGGLPGRIAVAVPERPGIFLAGDWVGSEGMLADASAASAAEAARRVLVCLPAASPISGRRPLHVNN
jgi:phytoene dehydrogenase-like protein